MIDDGKLRIPPLRASLAARVSNSARSETAIPVPRAENPAGTVHAVARVGGRVQRSLHTDSLELS